MYQKYQTTASKSLMLKKKKFDGKKFFFEKLGSQINFCAKQVFT